MFWQLWLESGLATTLIKVSFDVVDAPRHTFLLGSNHDLLSHGNLFGLEKLAPGDLLAVLGSAVLSPGLRKRCVVESRCCALRLHQGLVMVVFEFVSVVSF